MNKVIGGLLVISLLTTAPAKKTDYMIYQIVKIDGEIMHSAVNKNIEVSYHEEIDILMAKISESNIRLSYLIRQKNDIIHKIQSKMDLNAHYRIQLVEEQIEKFIGFTNIYANEKESLQFKLEAIYDNDDLNEVQQDLLRDNVNYELVIAKLRKLIDNQHDVIESLENIINMGMDTLDSLNT